MKVEPWCDDGNFLCEFKTLYLDDNGVEKIDVSSAKVHKNIVLMKFFEIDSIEQAELLRGKVLFMDRDEINLPSGEVFYSGYFGTECF